MELYTIYVLEKGISFDQFGDEFYKEHISTKSVCYKEYFYGEDGTVENEFANRENEQKKLLNQFVIYQYYRTLATYNHGKCMMSDMLSQISIRFLHKL